MSTAALSLDTLKLNGQFVAKGYAELMTGLTDLRVKQTITGASTVEVDIEDPKRTLLRSTVLGQRSRIVLDAAGYTLVALTKAGTKVTLTFEDDAVALLRKHTSYRKAAAGTSSRPGFIQMLIREEPDIKTVIATGVSKNLVELARGTGAPNKGISKVGADGKVVDAGTEDTWTTAGRIMGEIGWRVYCYRGVVYIAPDDWLIAHNGKAWTVSPDTVGIHDVDFEWDTGKPAAAATIKAQAGFRDLAPGQPIILKDLGAADGSWLVESIDRTPFSTVVSVTAVRPQPVLPEPKSQTVGDVGVGVYNGDYLGDITAGNGIDTEFKLAPVTPSGISALTSLLAEKFVNLAYSKRGSPYVYGAAGPTAWDCSGFVQWLAKQCGVNIPRVVSTIAAFCRAHGTTITVAQATYTRGAIVWKEGGGGTHDHIVISLGDGVHTIEAMGTVYGVVVGKFTGGRPPWTGAGWIPGIPVQVPALRDLRPG